MSELEWVRMERDCKVGGLIEYMREVYQFVLILVAKKF